MPTASIPITPKVQARCTSSPSRELDDGAGDDSSRWPARQSSTINIDRPATTSMHGGAWLTTEARDYTFLAEMFVKAGVHFVVPDFAPVEDFGGDLTALAEQVERSIAWVSHNASTFGGDARRIHLSGHSSGAHLLGVAITRDWKSRNDVDPRTLRSALLLSGIYDLEPVSLSQRSRYVQLHDPDVVADLSPVRNAKTFVCPVVVGYGSLDTPEYQRQSNALVEALKSNGKEAALLKAHLYNHFEQLETLGDPFGTFGRVALGQIASHHDA